MARNCEGTEQLPINQIKARKGDGKEIIMAVNEKNMTSGSPGKLIITFAIPLMLGNVFQQFYTMADTMIVGQVVGVEALAAVGAADWLVWLVFGIMTGMAQGFSILISQYYGAGEKENLKRAVAKSYVLTAILSIIVLVLSEVTVQQVLQFLHTPENVIGLSLMYIRMVFAGIQSLQRITFLPQSCGHWETADLL